MLIMSHPTTFLREDPAPGYPGDFFISLSKDIDLPTLPVYFDGNVVLKLRLLYYVTLLAIQGECQVCTYFFARSRYFFILST
jgi:hypothetical protein